MKKESRRSKLIKYHTAEPKHISKVKEAIGSKNKGTGIYALYKGKKLIYVGLSEASLRGRLKDHLKDKLKDKWDYYKWWQIRRKQYIKDVETIILQVHKPKYNDVGGKFKSKYKK